MGESLVVVYTKIVHGASPFSMEFTKSTGVHNLYHTIFKKQGHLSSPAFVDSHIFPFPPKVKGSSTVGAIVLGFSIKSRINLGYREADFTLKPVGGVDCDTLIKGSRKEVKKTEYAIKYAAPGGGLVITSGNSLMVGTKYENYLTVLETVRGKGRYSIEL